MTSPCVRLCTLDPANNTCVGCGRTLTEIAAWSRFSETERQAIIDVLPERLKRYGRPS
jgi:predicted Fe-S protein YdhL (DUF1289 family)